MKFMQPIVSLDQITGGTLSAGTVPWTRIFDLNSYADSGAIAVLGAYTLLANISCGTLAVGDRIFSLGRMKMTKGVVGGPSALHLIQSAGTGVIQIEDGKLDLVSIVNPHDANNNWETTLFGIWRCTTLGTVTLALEGLSGGSNGAVAVGASGLEIYRCPTG